ncbi:MAG: hypothetical protein KDC44_19445, partial [Phaeodactylibacter sp.]|nr:hypothetical protein [Phaeodactylibacter sp.]
MMPIYRLMLPFIFLLCGGLSLQAQEQLQLAPPLIRYDSLFFSDTAYAELIFGMPGAAIKFELQFGSVKFTNQTYSAPIKIHRSATLYYWTTHPDYKASKIQEANFFQRSKANFTVLDMTAPNALHPGNNVESLSDDLKADKSVTDPNWLGFSDSMVVLRIAPEEWPLEALVLSTLEHQEASVFLPRRVEVSAVDHKGNSTAFPTIVLEPEIRNPGPSYQLI